MKKIILIIAVLLMVSFVPDAFAHSHLESSTPSDGEVISEELREITLIFSGKIEQGSTFKLLDSKEQAVSVENITITDTEITGTIPVSLINGNYVVDWNIISADGHQMEGEFSFEVKIAGTESPLANNDEEEQVSKNVENHEGNQDGLNEQDSNENVANDQTENDISSNLVPIIIGVLIVTIIITFIALRRKK
ncbi:copper resistance CopC family protein [Bacillus sp. FJAT-27986]|uniref:copper resistance CopC family protein n=1 Tax=Bacillus sp. FJAT-27986 TaxID=1743146 RepID=UPI000980BE7A|nr:copper resistance protein CopC [Bacillus sp. FJAT-27986]